MTGISEIPENVDGNSIFPLMLEPLKQQEMERPLFWHYPHFSNQLGRPAEAVRVGVKLVELYENGDIELYNLKEDIFGIY